MSRYIDADKLALKWMLASPKQKETFRQIIDEEPTADAVEVVRCKDCKRLGTCGIHIFNLKDPNAFCSYGERREG